MWIDLILHFFCNWSQESQKDYENVVQDLKTQMERQLFEKGDSGDDHDETCGGNSESETSG